MQLDSNTISNDDSLVYCKKCLYPSTHGLGIQFDEKGVCTGCRIHEEKYTLDWSEKCEELKLITESYRSPGKYDCIVPVSGGR